MKPFNLCFLNDLEDELLQLFSFNTSLSQHICHKLHLLLSYWKGGARPFGPYPGPTTVIIRLHKPW